MNWRKPLIFGALYLSGSRIPKNLSRICSLEFESPEKIQAWQMEKLIHLLRHAYQNVPYYRALFDQASLFDTELNINFENWCRVPALTKEVLRANFDQIKSNDSVKRRAFVNTSGGSTGEPVRFLQDRFYRDWNYANKIYYKYFAGQDIGDRELRIWGSDRDILEGKKTLAIKARNWLYNRRELNAFTMNEEDLRTWVKVWNRYKPTWVEAYVQPIHEFARFVSSERIEMHSPKGILTSAGTLYPEMKGTIEQAFGCAVFNRYGTREVGDAACSCPEGEGLHLSPWNHYLEVLDDTGKTVPPGSMGNIHITTLNNFVQPLVRYKIGDIGKAASGATCSCGRGTPMIASVEGRETSLLKTRMGGFVPAEFFIHFVGVVFNEGALRKFQVIQKDYDYLQIKVVPLDMGEFRKSLPKLEGSIRKVMGEDCRVDWIPVEGIDPLPSGKYLYTVCEIPN